MTAILQFSRPRSVRPARIGVGALAFSLCACQPSEPKTPASAAAPSAAAPATATASGTVRVLSAEEHGMPQKVAVYDGPGTPEAAELFYRARMAELKWECDETFARLAKKQGKTSLRFDNARGHEVVLDLSANERQQGLTIVAVQTR